MGAAPKNLLKLMAGNLGLKKAAAHVCGMWLWPSLLSIRVSVKKHQETQQRHLGSHWIPGVGFWQFLQPWKRLVGHPQCVLCLMGAGKAPSVHLLCVQGRIQPVGRGQELSWLQVGDFTVSWGWSLLGRLDTLDSNSQNQLLVSAPALVSWECWSW